MKAYAVLSASLLVTISLWVYALADGSPPRTVIPADDPDEHPIGFFRGILPTRASGDDEATLYRTITPYTQFIPVLGNSTHFWDLSSDLRGDWGNRSVGTLVRNNGMFPLVRMSFFEPGLSISAPPWIPAATLSDPEWRSEYRKAALDVVNASRPAYLSLGDEVNLWYEEYGAASGDPNGFQNWVSLYDSLFDEIKSLSPNTTVFCTFAREVVSEGMEADMSVLSLFDLSKLDLIVLTSHPASVVGINGVSDIPDDYYSEPLTAIGKRPMGFSSISWPSFSSYGGEASQSSFIKDVVERLTRDQGLDLHLIGWSHLTDLGSGDRSGLRYQNGTAKLGLKAWKMNTAPYYIKENRTIDLLEDFGDHSYNLTKTFKDPDAWDHLSFRIRNETGIYGLERNFTLLDVRIEGQILHLISHPDLNGYVQLMVLATDHDEATAWALMQVNVQAVNDAPRIAFPFGTFEFMEDHSLDVQVSYHIFDPDESFDRLTMKVVASPDLTSTVYGAYLSVFSKEKDWYGDTYVVINVSDPAGDSIIANISFRMISANDPPIIGLPDHLEIAEDGFVDIDLNASISDSEGDPLIWNVSVVEGEVTAVIAGANLSIRLAQDWYGHASLQISADDGTDKVTHDLNLTVIEVNDPPRIEALSIINMTEDITLYYNLSSLHPSDVEGTALSWHINDYSDLFRSISILANGTMRLDPGTDDHGYAYVNTSLRDSSGGVTNVYFTVTIRSVNDPPYLLMRTNTTFKVDAGSFTLIDLERSPFILFDVERPNSELSAVTDCAICRTTGLVLNISVPENTTMDTMTVGVRVKDPEGAYSNETRITLEIRHVAKEYKLSIDSITTDTVDGKVRIMARGAPYQVVWVVFDDGTSWRMAETPPGNGKYVLDLGSGPWPDGAVLRFHLSTDEGGPNDTPWEPSELVYKAYIKETEKDLTWAYVLGLTLLVSLIMFIGIMVLIRRAIKQRRYSDLVEE